MVEWTDVFDCQGVEGARAYRDRWRKGAGRDPLPSKMGYIFAGGKGLSDKFPPDTTLSQVLGYY